MILALVLGFEFMILKLYHLRRWVEMTFKGMQQLETRICELENQLDIMRGNDSEDSSSNRSQKDG